MKIAVFSSGFLPVVDGVTVTLYHRLRRLSQWGHSVLLLCPDYSALAAVYPDWQRYTGEIFPGVRVVGLPSTPFMDLDFERNVSRAAYRTAQAALRQFQPDVIHVDEPERLFMGFWRAPGIDFARRHGIACVSFFHTNFLEYGEDYFAFPKAIDRALKFIVGGLFARIYSAYDATLVASSTALHSAERMGIRNARRAELLGVDLAQFPPSLRAPEFFAQRYGLPEVDRLVKLVFLGRLTPDKGWGFTLRALPQVAQAIDLRRVALLVAGDGPLQDEIAAQLRPIAPHLHFLGRVAPSDVPALLANSDLHVTASEKETRGLTILEAFAAGIPVLAPRAGGVVDSVRDGENGLLFRPQAIEDFGHKLKRLVEDAELRQRLGTAARQEVAAYGWDNSVRNLLKIWEEQIAQQRPSAIEPRRSAAIVPPPSSE